MAAAAPMSWKRRQWGPIDRQRRQFGGSIGDAERVALQQRMMALKLEHRDLDTAIERLGTIRRTTSCSCGD